VVTLGDPLLGVAKVLNRLPAALIVVALAAMLGLFALGGDAIELGDEFAFGLDGEGDQERRRGELGIGRVR
jgi:hypothetical protein